MRHRKISAHGFGHLAQAAQLRTLLDQPVCPPAHLTGVEQVASAVEDLLT